jgi:hypothetical protein
MDDVGSRGFFSSPFSDILQATSRQTAAQARAMTLYTSSAHLRNIIYFFIYLFMTYLTTLSIAYITQRSMIGWLQITWKGCGKWAWQNLKYLSRIFPEGLSKITKTLGQDSKSLG